MDKYDNPNWENQGEGQVAEGEMSHSDKIVGLITSPSEMYSTASRFPIRTIDWILPLIFVLIVTIISTSVVLSVPEIKTEVIQKAKEKIDKNIEDARKAGKPVDELKVQKEIMYKQMDYIGSPVVLIVQSIAIFVMGFVIFLIMTGTIFLMFKALFSSKVEFIQAMFIVGIVEYISVASILVSTLISFLTKKPFTGLNAAIFTTADSTSFLHLILSKLDPFSIATYVLIGVGYAKFSKSEKTKEYVLTMIAAWLGLSMLWFYASNNIPFLKLFAS